MVKTLERPFWRLSGVFNVKFEQNSYLLLSHYYVHETICSFRFSWAFLEGHLSKRLNLELYFMLCSPLKEALWFPLDDRQWNLWMMSDWTSNHFQQYCLYHWQHKNLTLKQQIDSKEKRLFEMNIKKMFWCACTAMIL